MAWSTPRSWTTGEVVTASLMNTYVSDNDSYLAERTIINRVAITSAQSPYVVPGWGYHVDVDASGGPVTVNLPTAASKPGALIEVRKTDNSANTVTVDGYGSETINGATTFVLYSQYDSVSLRSDGTNVMVV